MTSRTRWSSIRRSRWRRWSVAPATATARRWWRSSVLAAGAEITPDELIDWARDRIGGYKYPREVHVVDAIPLTPVGKIDRKAVRSRVTEASR